VELNKVLSSIAVAVSGAVLGGLAKSEIEGWLPRWAEILRQIAVKQTPDPYRDRFSEEWAAYLNDMPGPISKFLAGLGFVRAALECQFNIQFMLFKLRATLKLNALSSDALDPVLATYKNSLIRRYEMGDERASTLDFAIIGSLEFWTSCNRFLLNEARTALADLKEASSIK